jgi:quercetin dioxygenase-like cupin family protein
MIRPVALVMAGALAWLSTPAFCADQPDIHVDVPSNRARLEVNVVEHDFQPGQSSGWHIHHGVEITYVLSGEMNVQIGASPIRHVRPGDTFEIARDEPHRATNDGSTTARLLITYLRDKKGPLKIDVPPPAIR